MTVALDALTGARDPEQIVALRLLVRIHWWQRDTEKLRAALDRDGQCGREGQDVDDDHDVGERGELEPLPEPNEVAIEARPPSPVPPVPPVAAAAPVPPAPPVAPRAPMGPSAAEMERIAPQWLWPQTTMRLTCRLSTANSMAAAVP